jgi:hypothetical protein
MTIERLTPPMQRAVAAVPRLAANVGEEVSREGDLGHLQHSIMAGDSPRHFRQTTLGVGLFRYRM